MRKPPAIETRPGTLTVLSVSPTEEDERCLQAIISHSNWMLFQAHDLVTAVSLLRQHRIAVVLCERDLASGTWIDLLEHINDLPNVPSLIVTSRLADDRLWSEALNLGAWDVLAKPFDRREVVRSVKLAWSHWYHKTVASGTSAGVMAAAS